MSLRTSIYIYLFIFFFLTWRHTSTTALDNLNHRKSNHNQRRTGSVSFSHKNLPGKQNSSIRRSEPVAILHPESMVWGKTEALPHLRDRRETIRVHFWFCPHFGFPLVNQYGLVKINNGIFIFPLNNTYAYIVLIRYI